VDIISCGEQNRNNVCFTQSVATTQSAQEFGDSLDDIFTRIVINGGGTAYASHLFDPRHLCRLLRRSARVLLSGAPFAAKAPRVSTSSSESVRKAPGLSD
jgi:hypothetical protein